MKNGRKSREQGARSREHGAGASRTSGQAKGPSRSPAVARGAALADAEKSGRTRRSALPWIRSRRKWLIINERNFENFLPWTVNVHGSVRESWGKAEIMKAESRNGTRGRSQGPGVRIQNSERKPHAFVKMTTEWQVGAWGPAVVAIPPVSRFATGRQPVRPAGRLKLKPIRVNPG